MGYKTYIADDVFVVEWNTPTAGDVKQVIDEITRRHAAVGAKLAYVGVIPAKSKMPDDEGRQAVADALEALGRVSDERYVVYEGKGFAAATTRSVFSFIMMRSNSNVRAEVAPTLDEVVRRMKTDARRRALQSLILKMPAGEAHPAG